MSSTLNKTVLVVDDEEDIRTFLSTVLEDEGFDVMTAADGVEALERMREQIPDFISLDLVMPRKSGIRFLHELRRNKKWSSVPVLIVTGHARDEIGGRDLKEALDGAYLSGPGCYLEKPVRPESYVAAVKRELKIEDTSPAAPTEDPTAIRDEIVRLLGDADPEKLAELRKLLKS